MSEAALPSDRDASGRSFGDAELALLDEVIASGSLGGAGGRMVPRLEQGFAELCGTERCRATSSGSAALHAAIAAIDPEPGDEVVTSPITDMGAITPILYQSAVPVFADVDPETCNLSAETIAARLTSRTRAVIVTHLFGRCCGMDPILELCGERGIPVVEDAAQAYLATDRGRLAGTMGELGCFSLQQGKHMTCGEGGLVVGADGARFDRLRRFVDKAWGYGDPAPDHDFLALNYRMSELQAAVALAQLEALATRVEHRVRMADLLCARVAEIGGLRVPRRVPGSRHVFWRIPLRVDAERLRGGPDAFAAALARRGVPAGPRYIRKLAFECAVFKERRSFGQSGFPWSVGRELSYDASETPGARQALADLVVLPFNERYTEREVDQLAGCLREAAAECAS